MKKCALSSWMILALLFTTLAVAEEKQAEEEMPSMQEMALVRHANPMPNLMLTLMKHEQELALSDEQKKALTTWHKQMHPRMMKMVKQVVLLEQQIEEAALAGASGAVLQDLAMQLFNLRGAIIKQKLACRNNMARILGMEKMKKVIELYKADRAKAGGTGV